MTVETSLAKSATSNTERKRTRSTVSLENSEVELDITQSEEDDDNSVESILSNCYTL